MRYTRRSIQKITALLLALCLAQCFAASAAFGESVQEGAMDGTVRVYLSSLGQRSRVDLTVCGSYSLDGTRATALTDGGKISVSLNAATGRLTLTRDGVSGDMGGDFRLRRHDASEGCGVKIGQARVSGNLYPGDIRFRAVKSGGSYRLQVIAHVFIEDYLVGVLPYEMGNSSALEALKAQCVCARTYTVRAMRSGKSRAYDLVDTTNDQVYNGTPAGNARCRQAVEETRGIVAMNGGDFTATYYTASNGGQIESARNIWGYTGYDYIRVKDDPYDLQNPNSPVRSFKVAASGSQGAVLNSLLAAKARAVFGAENVTIDRVTAVTPHTPRYGEPSRLYTKLNFDVVATCDGVSRTGTLTFDIFSELEKRLGMSINGDNNELWSVTRTDSGFTVQARRFGHGTGMSQRGAMRMGTLGYTYDGILDFYFEGCERVQCAFVRSVWSPLGDGLSREELSVDAPAAVSAAAGGVGIVRMFAPDAEMALRRLPDAAAPVLCGIPHGAALTVHGGQNGWYLVTCGEMTGYVQGDGLQLRGAPDGMSPAVTSAVGYAVVGGAAYLNLRQQPSLTAPALAQIPAGTCLPVLRAEGGWAYTQYGSQPGYISMDFVTDAAAYTGAAIDANASGAEVMADTALYLSASLSGYRYTALPAGAAVRVIFSDGAWSRVEYQGVTGYALSAALRLNGAVIPAASDAPKGGEQYAQVASAASALNLRLEPSMTAQVMMTVPRGETLIVSETGAEWHKVRYQGVTGWCSARYLRLTGAAPATPAPSPAPALPSAPAASLWKPVPVQSTVTYAKVTTPEGSLNLRKKASASAAVKARIPRDEMIEVLSRGDKWTKVSYKDKTGYVMTVFLTFVEVPQPVAAAAMTARVVTPEGSLNLRKKASSGAKVLRTIPRDTAVIVLEYGEKWSRVSYGAATGYVKSAFLAFDQPLEAAPQPARVKPSGALMYAAPDAASAPVALLNAGDYALVWPGAGDWRQIEYDGRTGYAPAAGLELSP